MQGGRGREGGRRRERAGGLSSKDETRGETGGREGGSRYLWEGRKAGERRGKEEGVELVP